VATFLVDPRLNLDVFDESSRLRSMLNIAPELAPTTLPKLFLELTEVVLCKVRLLELLERLLSEPSLVLVRLNSLVWE